ncbi:MAG: ATP-binding cassette domain-containing protein [Acidobacteriota bacterium]|nr:ATP-binding cassette domain-containing protein [Blastocatellia bacterium]MDW8239772.1 ATP-binding cassette domain-containing protein [Acidobacteriota bacterium]
MASFTPTVKQEQHRLTTAMNQPHPQSNHYAVQLRHVQHTYDEEPVLIDISFTVSYGHMVVILGGSGSGKSTILRLVLGLIKPDSGEIWIDDEEITRMPEEKLLNVRRKMGIVFQGGALFDSLSIRDNVGYRLIEAGWPEEKIDEEVHRQLAFAEFTEDIDRPASDLSGGKRRIVAIARAMVGDPRILLFDEPSAGLDPPSARRLCELAAKYRDIRQVASIYVTHRMDDVHFLSSVRYTTDATGQVIAQHRDEWQDFALDNTRFIILRDHRIAFEGTVEEMLNSSDDYVQRFLGRVEAEAEELIVS